MRPRWYSDVCLWSNAKNPPIPNGFQGNGITNGFPERYSFWTTVFRRRRQYRAHPKCMWNSDKQQLHGSVLFKSKHTALMSLKQSEKCSPEIYSQSTIERARSWLSRKASWTTVVHPLLEGLSAHEVNLLLPVALHYFECWSYLVQRMDFVQRSFQSKTGTVGGDV